LKEIVDYCIGAPLIWDAKTTSNPLSCHAPARPAAARKDTLMRRFLTSTAIALALAGTTLAISAPASAAGLSVSVGNNRGYDNYNHRSSSIISVGFGDVAYGYRDGYWDSGHRWHHWRHHNDYRTYRGQDGNNYHDWNHDRDSDNGWQRR